VYTPLSPTEVEVTDMLAVKNPSTLNGDNLAAVWYESGPDGWAAQSWYASDPWTGVKSLKITLGIGDEQDAIWEMTLGAQPSGDPIQAAPLTSAGVIENDPLQPMIEASADPEAVVQTLITLG
jgi:hypothetical protein